MRDLISSIDRLIEPEGRYKPSVRLAWACILLVLMFLFSAVMFLLVNRAEAQALCAPWPELKKQFSERLHEETVSTGQVSPTLVLVIIASPEGETWTAIAVHATGMGCILSAGKNWEPGRNRPKAEVRG